MTKMDKDDSQTINFNKRRGYLHFSRSFELEDFLRSWRHATFLDTGENYVVPEDFTKKEMQTGAWWRLLVAGAIAGGVSRTCTAPLDRIKVFFQVRSGEYSSIGNCLRDILKEGGVVSLWRGNGVNVFKIAPETAIKFAAYEQLKHLIRGDSERELRIYERFIAGSIAGGIAQSSIYPLEVLKTRLALRKTGQYKSAWDAACKIYTTEGLRSFYKGYLPNVLGIIPYAGTELAIYETLKKSYKARHPEAKEPGPMVLLGCVIASSSCGQITSYPLALIRTRLQAQAITSDHPQEAGTMIGLFKTIVKREGVAGLYHGITPNFMKVVPAVGEGIEKFMQEDRLLCGERKQPFVLAIGENLNPIQKFIIFEKNCLEISSLLKAVDVCFKLTYILNLEFSLYCSNVWNFLNSCFYKCDAQSEMASCIRELKERIFLSL